MGGSRVDVGLGLSSASESPAFTKAIFSKFLAAAAKLLYRRGSFGLTGGDMWRKWRHEITICIYERREMVIVSLINKNIQCIFRNRLFSVLGNLNKLTVKEHNFFGILSIE